MRIITIIPAYNEEKAIKDVVKGVGEYSDVLVVDDGSIDHTSFLANEAGARIIKHERNIGKGAAIKTGLDYAIKEDYRMVILLDGDGQHDPRCIPELLEGMEGVDMRIGSRFQGNYPLNMPLQRRLSNGITTRLIRLMTGYHITDSQCGFRVISGKVAPFFLDIPYDDYVYESEVLYRAWKNRLIVDEKPIKSIYGEEKSYVRTRHVLHYILFILRVFMRKISGRI
jgi:glycosyltransferase involved in cell wall biosynthesis